MKPQVPPPQHNLQDATDMAVATLAGQSAEQLSWLGAERAGDAWRLQVLYQTLDIDITSGDVRDSSAEPVKPFLRLLALHYLAITGRPPSTPPEITFATISGARTYAKVYSQRVNGRLCATAGRDLATLRASVESVGGREVEGGDAAFEILFAPRLTTRLIWYAADEDFPPSATLLLPGNIEEFFCVEDIVVMSESIVARLSA